MKKSILSALMAIIITPILAQGLAGPILQTNKQKSNFAFSVHPNKIHQLISAKNEHIQKQSPEDTEIYNLDSLIWLWSENGQWTNSSKDEYEYFDSGNTKTWRSAYSDWESGNWLYSTQTEYEYNADGLILQEILSNWNSEQSTWIRSSRTVNTYNENQELTNTSVSEWNQMLNFWLPSSSTDYSYNENHYLTEIIVKQWYYVYWVNSSKTTFEYNSQNLEIVQTNYLWDNEWIVSDKSEKEYDENGNLTLFTNYYWNQELSQWENSYRYMQQYDAYENLILRTEMYWDAESEEWIGNYKSDLIYNKNNQMTEQYISYFDYVDHVYVYYDKYTYEYDYLGNLTTTIYYSTGNIIWEKDTEWYPNTKTVNTYNYEYGLSELYVPSSYDFQYMITDVVQEFWNEDHWESSYLGTFYYSLHVNTNYNITAIVDLMVFPNPAIENLNINWSGSIPQFDLQVVDSKGQLVLTDKINKNHVVNIESLSTGTYVFKFTNSQQHIELTKKVVIR